MCLLFYLTHFKPLEQKSRKQNLEYLWTLQFSSEISWPLKRVYWVDTYLDYIEAVDYDGGNRKTILRGSPVQNLYSASVFENSLYLTSWRNNSILRVNKFHPVKVRIFWEGHKNMTKSPSFFDSTTNVLGNSFGDLLMCQSFNVEFRILFNICWDFLYWEK